MFYVYILKNTINTTVYIGFTSKPNARMVSLIFNDPNTRVKKAIKKLGSDNFYMEVLQEFETKEEALESEMWWIKTLRENGTELYNGSDGGEDPTDHLQKSAFKKSLKYENSRKK